jgi:hypothetical protein
VIAAPGGAGGNYHLAMGASRIAPATDNPAQRGSARHPANVTTPA